MVLGIPHFKEPLHEKYGDLTNKNESVPSKHLDCICHDFDCAYKQTGMQPAPRRMLATDNNLHVWLRTPFENGKTPGIYESFCP